MILMVSIVYDDSDFNNFDRVNLYDNIHEVNFHHVVNLIMLMVLINPSVGGGLD